MEKQWKLFTKQMIRTCQLLPSFLWKPAAPKQLLSGPDEEFSNLKESTPLINHSFRQPLSSSRENLHLMEPQYSSKCMKRSLLPFLGDALSWLTGTATTKDVNTIKSRINQLISTQQNQQEILVHMISVLNVTRYTTQVNRQSINILMDEMEKTHQDITTLYNITHSFYSISATTKLYYTSDKFWPSSGIPYTTCKKKQFPPWIISMQPLQEYSHHIFYLSKI